MSKTKKLPVKIKIGDQVTIISGFYKGQIGQILKINKKTGRIIIKGINFKFKHIKPKTPKDIGQIIQFEAPIHHSNIKVK